MSHMTASHVKPCSASDYTCCFPVSTSYTDYTLQSAAHGKFLCLYGSCMHSDNAGSCMQKYINSHMCRLFEASVHMCALCYVAYLEQLLSDRIVMHNDCKIGACSDLLGCHRRSNAWPQSPAATSHTSPTPCQTQGCPTTATAPCISYA